MKKPCFVLAAALLNSPLFLLPAGAQTTVVPASSEAAAMALVDKSAAAYAALRGLSMKFTEVDNQDGQILRAGGTIAFEKSGRVRLTSSMQATLLVNPRAAANAEAAKAVLRRAMLNVASGIGLPLAALVVGKNPLRENMMPNVPMKWSRIRLLPDGGVAARATPLKRSDGEPLDFTFYFDKRDALLRRVEVKEQNKGKKFHGIDTLSDIKINLKLAPDTFVVPQPAKP